MAPEQCPNCRLALPTENGFIFCSKCKVPSFLGDLRSPFEILGVKPSFNIDEKALEQNYFGLTRKLHPDRFSALASRESGPLAGQARLKSHELSAALNQSYQALRYPEARLETLLKSAGALQESRRSGDKGTIPEALAEEFFELQEAVMDDPTAAKGRIDIFDTRVRTRDQALTDQMFAVASNIDWTQPDRTDLEKVLSMRRERSYLRSLIENISQLRSKIETLA